MIPLRTLLAAVLLSAVATAGAQQVLEVIPLRHSTVEQVLPALRPLLEPGGTLTGQYSQLIVRASPGNIDEIRRALDAIDRPRRRLQVSVRFDEVSDSARRGIEAGGRISNRGSEIQIRAQDAARAGEERVDQRVQVLEGGRAVILYGQSRPALVRERLQTPAGTIGQDALVMRETASGFEIVPRLAGSRVQLDIAPQRERFASGGAVDVQRVAATVSAALGEWVEIGGAVEHATGASSGIASSAQARSSVSRRIWVRVDEVRN
ncbi:MAG TPA: secretin N-terminal domain-containing protein [Burkholderiales bacterium]|nr:secretin N-terminal domain-containing protein [Burkholderiales bacterium]